MCLFCMSDYFAHTFVCAPSKFYTEKHSDCRRLKNSKQPVNKNSSVFACLCEHSCLLSTAELFCFFTLGEVCGFISEFYVQLMWSVHVSLADCQCRHSRVARHNES